MVVKFTCIARAMVYFSLPEKSHDGRGSTWPALALKIRIRSFKFLLYSSGNRSSLSNRSLHFYSGSEHLLD